MLACIFRIVKGNSRHLGRDQVPLVAANGDALAGLRQYLTPEDRALLPEIEALIEATHYPYKIESDKLDLLGQIIRDADLAQALSPVWIQQIVIGLAQEWRSTPLQVLEAQVPFFTALRFTTPWAQPLGLGARELRDPRPASVIMVAGGAIGP